MLLLWSLFPTPQSLTLPRSTNSPSWNTRALAAERGKNVPQRSQSALETQISLILVLASQASSLAQQFLSNLVEETAKYSLPRRFEARTLEEALILVWYQVLKKTDQYEVREVEAYYIAETTMPGKTWFDFNGASQGFNMLAEYLLDMNTSTEQIEMTTTVITRKVQTDGAKMDMTTPVISKQVISEQCHLSCLWCIVLTCPCQNIHRAIVLVTQLSQSSCEIFTIPNNHPGGQQLWMAEELLKILFEFLYGGTR